MEKQVSRKKMKLPYQFFYYETYFIANKPT